MSAAATIPFTANPSFSPSPPPSSAPNLNPEPRTLNPWTPTDRDRLIFQWVKFDGHKQSWVASQLGMHQTTVFRIVDRYERWIAHGGPSQQGGLSRDERLRAQRWLTYERNEWILNSALRIAAEMENPIDISTTNIKKTPQDYTKELEVRTQHAVLHRSGIAARFLRLAYRINMDQLKLLEQEPLPDLEPLSIEDLDEGSPLGPQAESVRNDSPDSDTVSIPLDRSAMSVVSASSDPDTSPTEGLPAGCHGHLARADRANKACPADDSSNSPFDLAVTDEQAATDQKPPPDLPSPIHMTHIEIDDEQPLTACSASDYDQIQPVQKISSLAYAVAASPPGGMGSAGSIALAPPSEQK